LKEALPEAATRAAASKLPGLGYAVAYPFGVLGIILVMLAVRTTFGSRSPGRQRNLEKSRAARLALAGRTSRSRTRTSTGCRSTRCGLAGSGSSSPGSWQDGTLLVRGRRRACAGDVLLAVGTREELDALRVVVGKESSLDLRRMPSAITSKRLIVTTPPDRKTVAALDFARRFGVQITRVSRTRSRCRRRRTSSCSTATPCSR